MSYAVLLTDRIPEAGLHPLRSHPDFELVERLGLDEAGLRAALREVDGVIIRSGTNITRAALEGNRRLRVIGRAGVGVDNIDVGAATELGIAVLNAPSGNTVSAAELTLALMLALVRRIPAAHNSMTQGEWDRKRFKGIELNGKTLGLVGAGRIGGEVARRARAFGMRVMAHDPYLKEDRAEALDIELASLDDVLAQADVLSLHVPLTETTARLIGDDQLQRMKPGAVLVNAARGGVLDEDALGRALASGHLAGAALDVYETEPLPEHHPLRRMERVVLTPHLGAATEEAQHNVAIEVAHAVRDALTDGDFSRAVNAPAIGGEAMRRLRPMMELAERLGHLGCALADHRVESFEVRYAGSNEDALKPLVAAALVGLLSGILGRGAVNLVNAMHLADGRGIEVRRVKLGPHADYAEHLELRLTGSAGDVRVAGALLGESHARIVRINEFHVDVRPAGVLVIIRNRDVPGVIGRVGTILGDAGINIGEYHQARLEAGGEAMAAISVDGSLDPEVIEGLRSLPEVIGVRQLTLD